MNRCLNPRCGNALMPDWAFCDRCGTDNRPPTQRVRVEEDEHFAPNGEFCVRCGVSILDATDDTDHDENRLHVYAGWAALGFGALGLLLSYVLRPAHAVKTSDEPSSYQLAYMFGRYGSYLFAAGVVILLITPALKRRR